MYIVDKPTMYVGELRLARRRARQAKSKRENKYVIKVMKPNATGKGKGDRSFCPREPKVVRSLLIGL
jgi:hypothetical protein